VALRASILDARYSGLVALLQKPALATDPLVSDVVRDPLVPVEAVLAARRRPMPERLELALSWNAVAAELRAGLLAARQANPSQ
jgi:hypothetical protein